jgi:oligoendopeptidase F
MSESLLETPLNQKTDLSGPEWSLADEYARFQSEAFQLDYHKVQDWIQDLEEVSAQIAPWIDGADTLNQENFAPLLALTHSGARIQQEIHTHLNSLRVYANCISTVDGKDVEAKEWVGKIGRLSSEFQQANEALELFLFKCPEDYLLDHTRPEDLSGSLFRLQNERKRKEQLLSLSEEKLISALSVDGFEAWGRLYDQLSATLTCPYQKENGAIEDIGLSEASSMIFASDEKKRKQAWHAIQKGWEAHTESCASILNAISGWRLEVLKKRTKGRNLPKEDGHFLSPSLHQARTSRATLDAMFQVTEKAGAIGRKVLDLKAKTLGKKQLDPWDLLAAPPTLSSSLASSFLPAHSSQFDEIPFERALDLIKNAFHTLHPEAADFVQMMADKGWIEGSRKPNKRPGAFCTKFLKSRNPRVYMTYTGEIGNVLTLAHELGHAYHNWLMRDLPISATAYPMTLAETASIFSETLLLDQLIHEANTPEELFPLLWEDTLQVSTFLLNIPARFEFEKRLYESRSEKEASVESLKKMMSESWTQYYGNSLSQMDELFWANKLHFYITSVSFYNFPYTFGYLFGLGVYQRKEALGDDFFPVYQNLLRDTGTHSVEEVAKKHLKTDLTQVHFWEKSIEIIEKKVDRFEKLVSSIQF